MSAKTIVEAIPEIKATVYQSGGKSDNKIIHSQIILFSIYFFYPLYTL